MYIIQCCATEQEEIVTCYIHVTISSCVMDQFHLKYPDVPISRVSAHKFTRKFLKTCTSANRTFIIV